jgi:hypothetical protein
VKEQRRRDVIRHVADDDVARHRGRLVRSGGSRLSVDVTRGGREQTDGQGVALDDVHLRLRRVLRPEPGRERAIDLDHGDAGRPWDEPVGEAAAAGADLHD